MSVVATESTHTTEEPNLGPNNYEKTNHIESINNQEERDKVSQGDEASGQSLAIVATTDTDLVVDEEHTQSDVPIREIGPLDHCDTNPNFDIICSFIERFGEKLGIDLDISRLKFTLEDDSKLHDDLVELHVKLLRKRRKYFLKDQWEKALTKFACEYSYTDAWELERLGYRTTRVSVKLELLKRLMEVQFECDPKLKQEVNLMEADELRLLPIGKDNKGNVYWSRKDNGGNFMVYKEHSMDYKSWSKVCSEQQQLQELIDQLNSSINDNMSGERATEPYFPLPDIFPDLFIREEEPLPVKPSTRGRGRRGRGRSGRGASRAISINDNLTQSSKSDGKFSDTKNVETNIATFEHSAPGPFSIFKQHGNPSFHCKLENNIKTEPCDEDDANDNNVHTQVKSLIDSLLDLVCGKLTNNGSMIDLKPSLKTLNKKLETIAEMEDQADVVTNAAGATIETTDPEQKPRKRPGRRKKAEIQATLELPRRASSRIQQLQLKKIAEQEEEIKKKIDQSQDNRKSRSIYDGDDESTKDTCHSNSQSLRLRIKVGKNQDSDGEYEVAMQNSKKRKKKKRKRGRPNKKNKKLAWDKDDSDLSSSETSSTSSDDFDELDHQHEADEAMKFDDNDDEFACEEVDTSVQPIILRRARTARKICSDDELTDPSMMNESSICEEDKPCGRCAKSDDPEWILLCDKCDRGYHTMCCIPPLMIIPDGDWFCPPCEHSMLIERLTEFRDTIIVLREAQRVELAKRKRSRQKPKPVEVPENNNETNVEVPDVTGRRQARVMAEELSDPLVILRMDEEEEYDEVHANNEDESDADNYDEQQAQSSRKSNQSNKRRKKNKRGRPCARNLQADFIEVKRPKRTYSRTKRLDMLSMSEDSTTESGSSQDSISESDAESDYNDGPIKSRRARKQISYRFKEYDELMNSAIEGEAYDASKFKHESSSDDEAGKVRSRGKDMAVIEAANRAAMEEAQAANGGDPMPSGIEQFKIDSDEDTGKKKRRKKARRLNDLNSPGETEEEQTSDESFKASSATELEDEEEEEEKSDGDTDSDTSLDEIAILARRKQSKRRFGSAHGKKNKKSRRSAFDESDSDYEPRSRRRAATKRVSYKESSEDEDTDLKESEKKRKKKRNKSSDESEDWADDDSTEHKRPGRFIDDDDEDQEEQGNEVDEDSNPHANEESKLELDSLVILDRPTKVETTQSASGDQVSPNATSNRPPSPAKAKEERSVSPILAQASISAPLTKPSPPPPPSATKASSSFATITPKPSAPSRAPRPLPMPTAAPIIQQADIISATTTPNVVRSRQPHPSSTMVAKAPLSSPVRHGHARKPPSQGKPIPNLPTTSMSPIRGMPMYHGLPHSSPYTGASNSSTQSNTPGQRSVRHSQMNTPPGHQQMSAQSMYPQHPSYVPQYGSKMMSPSSPMNTAEAYGALYNQALSNLVSSQTTNRPPAPGHSYGPQSHSVGPGYTTQQQQLMNSRMPYGPSMPMTPGAAAAQAASSLHHHAKTPSMSPYYASPVQPHASPNNGSFSIHQLLHNNNDGMPSSAIHYAPHMTAPPSPYGYGSTNSGPMSSPHFPPPHPPHHPTTSANGSIVNVPPNNSESSADDALKQGTEGMIKGISDVLGLMSEF